MTTTPQRFAELIVDRNRNNLLFGQPTGCVDYEASGFQCMVPTRDLDLIRKNLADHRARKLRAVNLLALLHESEARQWIVMLPAGERTDPTESGVDSANPCAVSLSPHHALVVGRRDFSPFQH